MSGIELPMYTVDAFSDGPFSGNPAAVCPLRVDQEMSDARMLQIAAEMNLSETAYVQALDAGTDFKTGKKFGLRWFTPSDEVPLCGHATVASASVLFNCYGNPGPVEFVTRKSGNLFVRRDGDHIVLDAPVNSTVKKDVKEFAELAEALQGVEVVEAAFNASLPMVLLRLPDSLSMEQFESFSVDYSKLMTTSVTRMLSVTMRADPGRGFTDSQGRGFDFVGRFFAPWFGINEDPVTGAAHTVLAHYWSQELNKKQLYARQCSVRGGNVGIKVQDNGRVELSGQGRVMIRGTLSL